MNYAKILNANFPEIECSFSDPEDYSSFIFHGASKTQAELDALWLPVHKADRVVEIDNKSAELIAAGFTYDSQSFDAQLEDRVNYGHMEQFQALLPWPLDIHTKTGGVYSLAQANITAFIGAALNHVNTILAQGNALKASVDSAVDEAAVDAVVDNR